MKTSLIDCDVKITRTTDTHKEKWIGHLGQIVTIFISKQLEPKYTIMFERGVEGTLVNFHGTEFVILLAGDGNER